MTAIWVVTCAAFLLVGLVYGYRCGRRDEADVHRDRSEFIDGRRR